MLRLPASLAAPLLAATTVLTAACGLQINTGGTPPSAYALNHPDSSRVTSGRVVRFAGNYGLLGPSPAFVFRDVNGQVTGQMLVWYRRYEPIEAGGRSAADSAAQWGRMQSAMRADRARFDSTYHCTAWAKGYQEGKSWVCRVPEQRGPPNWAAALARLDSLALARRSAEPTGGRRPDPIAPPPPPPPANPGVAQLRPRDGVCMDGGSWNIVTRDARGTSTVNSPQPGAGCNPPEGPAKTYDKAGWQMLKDFIGAVVPPKPAT